MEFLAGIIFTLFFGFVGNTIYQSWQKKKARKAYVPMTGDGASGRPVKDYPGERRDDR